MVPGLHIKVINYQEILQQYHFAATNQGRRRLLKSGTALERRFPSVDGSGKGVDLPQEKFLIQDVCRSDTNAF